MNDRLGSFFSTDPDVIFASSAFNRYRLYLASIVLFGNVLSLSLSISLLSVKIARESLVIIS